MATTKTTKAAATKKDTGVDTPISIPAIEKRRMEVELVGDEGLICHRWSKKAETEMLGKQMKLPKGAKEAKDPEMDYWESLYWLTPMPARPTAEDIAKARFGFPAIAFKNAAVTAAGDVDGAKKTETRRRFHVLGEYVEIEGTPVCRGDGLLPLGPTGIPTGDMVRVGMGTADIRFRGWFPTWRARVRIEYNARAISPAQVVNLLNLAGFGVGIGEWRPERNGQFGRFHVATESDRIAE